MAIFVSDLLKFPVCFMDHLTLMSSEELSVYLNFKSHVLRGTIMSLSMSLHCIT